MTKIFPNLNTEYLNKENLETLLVLYVDLYDNLYNDCEDLNLIIYKLLDENIHLIYYFMPDMSEELGDIEAVKMIRDTLKLDFKSATHLYKVYVEKQKESRGEYII